MQFLRNYFAALLVTAFALSAVAEIRETKEMAEVLADVKSGDVVVFDIDNTTLEPVQTLGSDQWFSYLVEKYTKTGLTLEEALSKSSLDWNPVQFVTNVQTVEPETPDRIRDLQARGIFVMALTARSPDVREATLRQLRSVGISFNIPGITYTGEGNVAYDRGVLLVAGADKGKELVKFLQAQQMQPSKIIFVDDKPKNVSNVDAAFANSGIVNINYRYGAADERVKAFDANVAETEFSFYQQHDGALLNDEQAAELVSSQH